MPQKATRADGRRRRNERVAGRLAQASFAARLERLRIPVRLAYVGIILLATLSSLALDPDAGAVGARFERMLRPETGARDVVDGVRNVALFIGWGLVWMVTAPAGRSRAALRDAIWTGAALSLAVESMQLFSDTRVASILDLLTNTGGTIVGALVLIVAVMSLARLSRSRSFVGIPALIFALCYGCAVLGEALVPLFRESIVLGGPLERFALMRADFSWASLLSMPAGDFLLFLPAGVFAVAALYEGGMAYGTAARRVSVGALALFVVAEVAHGFMGIPIMAGSAVVHVLAVVIGAMLAVLVLPGFSRRYHGPERPRVLTQVYLVVLFLWALRPYRLDLAPDLSAKISWVPLQALGMRVDMFSVVDVSGPFLLYLAFGALLAVWPVRLRGRLSGFAPAIYVAVATELAQIIVAERLLDVTDLLIQASGAAAGWVVVRRAGFRPYGAQLANAVRSTRPDLDRSEVRRASERTAARGGSAGARRR